MARTTVYRVQPAGLGLDHQTETSEGNLANGVHVFGSISELIGGVLGWLAPDYTPEILAIRCDASDLRDYEGYTLPRGRGRIAHRRKFADWKELYWTARDHS